MHFDQLRKNMVLSHLIGDELFIVTQVGKDQAYVQPAIGGKVVAIEPDHPFLRVVEPQGVVA